MLSFARYISLPPRLLEGRCDKSIKGEHQLHTADKQPDQLKAKQNAQAFVLKKVWAVPGSAPPVVRW